MQLVTVVWAKIIIKMYVQFTSKVKINIFFGGGELIFSAKLKKTDFLQLAFGLIEH